jgi:prostaglandin-H2 D-isomerase / glutathione transferase
MIEVKYFDSPGRADVIRILLHAAKVEWKNTHISFADWATVKATLPLGSAPTMTIDGTEFCQSVALQRYVANMVGLYPKDDPLKALIVDEMMDSLNECLDKCPFTGTEEEKKVSRPAFQKGAMTQYFGLVESRIQKFGSNNTVCGIFTVADLYLMTVCQFLTSGMLDHIDTDFFKDYPGITACIESAAQHEFVVSYKASVEKK